MILVVGQNGFWPEASVEETDLKRKLDLAQDEYAHAKATYQRLMAVHDDLGMSNPDGRMSLRKAIEIQRTALANYSDALRAFNAYVRTHDPFIG